MNHKFRQSFPEIWGGIECTINRIGDVFPDQLQDAGHYSRDTDIDSIARLGITTLRYPVLWERHQPELGKPIDWEWTARQLDAICSHGLVPVVGLLHHGSGPAFTDLASPDFADHFAAYAGQVAARFPWLEFYTPINEPLTTARFSGLYGLWYPHMKDPLAFMRMLLNQVKGIVNAMKAIRAINPGAKLVQTEDLAHTHSTASLHHQRDFENHRRWLTFDLLTGRVDRQHPLWDYFLFIGIGEAELAFFTENPCIPDLIGLNYYVTSERFLDDDLSRYPAHTHGGNGQQAYVDTEAVRTIEPAGLFALLQTTWDRYGLPMVISEAHLNCTREEQMRWIKEVWDISCRAKNAGMDLRAVTVWALLGAYDWDSLLTRKDRHYEPGAYAIENNELVRTAIGTLVRALADNGDCQHPLLTVPGWWRRRGNLHMNGKMSRSRLLIITDGDDQAGLTLGTICRNRGLLYRQLTMPSDPPDPEGSLERSICSDRPWALIVLSGQPDEVARVKTACQKLQVPFLHMDPGAAEFEINNLLDALVDKAVKYSFYVRK